jgi:hypothetical protein
VRSADPDDIDARFEALVAQFHDEERDRELEAEIERMRRTHTLPRRRTRGLVPIVVIVVFALVVAVGLVISLRPELLGVTDKVPLTRPTKAPAAVRPVPEETGPARLTLPAANFFDAFADSKAAGYANGAAGIELPPAKALGGLSKKEVKAALKGARDLLIAANLDLGTVRGGRPKAFIKLLEADQRKWFVDNLDHGRRSDARKWVFSLKPGTAELTSDVIKVDGETRISKPAAGGVRITLDYVFVYAVNRPGKRDTMIRLVAHKKGVIHAYRANGKITLRVDDFTSKHVFGASCDFHDGFVHPAYRDQPSKIQPSGKPNEPNDRTPKGADKGGCPLTTGT